ncbi:terminal deoxynucleotidyl transferase [Aspergillus steynii IBT 23096]|uniref:Terminal deoxynucleotidyl transferase n=1 Tax=Aspergillus steynii IBT 23096 TaxID=1392250 RepID=A0A2I2G2P1_9EURO|nr:terminal deoxynucleotidyl transferase [Aspergillus steynii IBT 23096]PLB47153.1 terminal deoxynucleotidyl transferase [Aspergillus steynii IBT 23096]
MSAPSESTQGTIQAGSQSQSQTEPQSLPSQTKSDPQSRLDLKSLPLVFVLPTHLSLDALHSVEDHLVRGAAHLTYDVSEAGLVLGRLSHKKRAALELRARGVWTEEVLDSDLAGGRGRGDEPPSKKARVSTGNEPNGLALEGKGSYLTGPAKEVVELDTETESEEDGMEGHRVEKHLKRPQSESVSSGATRKEDFILVVKLDWLDRCLTSDSLLPMDPYLIYRARKIARPATSPSTKSTSIIQRARQDVSALPSHPPKLHRTTTSEAEEDKTNLPPPPDWVRNRLPYACQRHAPLHPPNEGFIHQLLKIRQIRQLTLDEIAVRAYSTSIAAIAAYPYKLRRASEILSLPGCDAKTAHLFSEYQSSASGSLAAASQLDTDATLRTLHTFTQIWGVGAKTARDFYYSRHWRDLDDIILHGWSGLSRVQQIGVKYYDEFLLGISRPQVESIASTVHRHANLVRPDDGEGEIECIIVGGYRRGKDRCGDVDLILTHRDDAITHNLVVDVLASLEASHYITHTLHLNLSTSDRDQQTLPYRGDAIDGSRHFDTLDKALVVWQDPIPPSTDSDAHPPPQSKGKNKNTNPHQRVDIIVSPWRSIGCAVLGWTGDTTFERDLRRLAKKEHNWKFDSSGVRERDGKGRVLDLEARGKTWEERERLVFEAIVGRGSNRWTLLVMA